MEKDKYGRPIRKSLFEKMLEDDNSKITKYIFVVCALIINTIFFLMVIGEGLSLALIATIIIYLKILYIALKK